LGVQQWVSQAPTAKSSVYADTFASRTARTVKDRLLCSSVPCAVTRSFQTSMHAATMCDVWRVPPTKAASGFGSGCGRVDTAKVQLPDCLSRLILISCRNRVDLSSGYMQPDFTCRSTILHSKPTYQGRYFPCI
jgi:hypothetical protein